MVRMERNRIHIFSWIYVLGGTVKPSASDVTYSEGLIFNNLSKNRKSYTGLL